MKSEKGAKGDLTNELVNIATIREAEQAQREAVAKAKKVVAVKIAAAVQEADKVKEKVISDARSERKRMIQQAIDQTKDEAKAIMEEQVHTSNDLVSRGEKWISSAAEFAVKYILGIGQENAE